jgi:hypothetical protein
MMNDQLNNGSVREGSQASSLNYSTGIIGRIFSDQGRGFRAKGYSFLILMVQILIVFLAVITSLYKKANLVHHGLHVVSKKQIF